MLLVWGSRVREVQGLISCKLLRAKDTNSLFENAQGHSLSLFFSFFFSFLSIAATIHSRCQGGIEMAVEWILDQRTQIYSNLPHLPSPLQEKVRQITGYFVAAWSFDPKLRKQCWTTFFLGQRKSLGQSGLGQRALSPKATSHPRLR